VGSSPSAEEVDVDEEGHIEVACTAHTNTGVRSLVKSVVRGLKVCTGVMVCRQSSSSNSSSKQHLSAVISHLQWSARFWQYFVIAQRHGADKGMNAQAAGGHASDDRAASMCRAVVTHPGANAAAAMPVGGRGSMLSQQ
jgi:hypothetical protein